MEPGTVIKADNWLDALLCGGGDMVEPIENPCVDCPDLSCFGCPLEEK